MRSTLTSVLSNRLVDREGRCKKLLDLYTLGPCTDREAARKLGWDRSDVSARRNDLIEYGEVGSLGEVKDYSTNRRVNVWGITKQTLF